MADSLVQQHSRPSRAEHNFHVSSRSLTGVQLKNGLPRRFFGKVLRRFFAKEEVQCDPPTAARSEEHTSELQSRGHLVCRLLLEKKNCCLFHMHTLTLRHSIAR